ncbi:MAG TPA: RluA family pseudouridine synthase [Pseudothermotoga sp.]|nr:RluA family pseudouridine synthase [Pseudothermotoga sp.]HPP70374.1 RluA family pseudouridine synthase [Pseudothermotoga sp.]
MEIKVSKGEQEQRLDLYLLEKIPAKISRNFVQKAIKDGRITVNGRPQKPSYRVKAKDIISVPDPEPPVPLSVEPEPIKLEVLYEDSDLIVINKPAGMIVHPVPSHTSGTLVNALLYHCHDLQGIGGELRPGIVHRLDKDTSGVIVVAKNDLAHRNLSQQFKDRKVSKMYLALVRGKVNETQGEITVSLARHPVLRTKMSVNSSGRAAVTFYRVLKYFDDVASLVAAYPKTGRTHQIRVHMKYIGHPILGDRLYGSIYGAPRQMLHAMKLGFYHPRSGNWLSFTAALPEDFKHLIVELSSRTVKNV